MKSHLTRDEILAALIRHPDWDLAAARPSDIWALSAGEQVSPDAQYVIDRRLEEFENARAIEAEYEEKGIWVITCADNSYPERLHEKLGARAPALLYGFGERNLLHTDGIGVVGSRNLSTAGKRVAEDLAKAIAQAGRILVSGGARGADQIAMRGAVESKGSVIGVTTHPLTRSMRENETRELADQGRICLVTPFQPDMGFTVANAMARNKIIYALTDCTVVVSADLNEGGSWAGATEALRHDISLVAVWNGFGAGDGNRALAEKGAVRIDEASQALDRDWLDSERDRFEPQQQFNLGSPLEN